MKHFLKSFNSTIGIFTALYSIYKLDDLIYSIKYKKH